MNRRTLAIAAAALSLFVALTGVIDARGTSRVVDVVRIFFGGVAAGAALVTAIRPRRRQAIFPALKFRDAPQAITWLDATFGFSVLNRMDRPDGGVAHAELKRDGEVLMLGSYGPPGDANPWSTSPGVYVRVPDIDAHYNRARAAGARIVRELHDTSYGAREYTTRDLEGNLWSFGTYGPEP